MQNFDNTLTSFLNSIRFVDILDIALASCILYFILNWMRKNVAGRSLVGFSILGIIYAAARLTGMYLTELFIEAFFVVFLIGVVIVFQSDIRRLVDRIGNWNLFGSSSSSSYNTTNIITEAAANMAKQKTGALLAVKGDDNWERQTHGGINLNGAITVPLLFSIFNPKAPGHDGAVLIEDNVITRFGVHLPLSTNLNKISKGGTRHAAALGLSEQCDALIVVVSEERGVVSVAQNGRIQTLSNNNDLKEHLDNFWKKHYTTNKTIKKQWWKRSSPQTAIGAIVLAFIFWLAFVYQPGTVYRTFEVPIEYRNIQANTSLQESLPVEIRITLAGPAQAFENFESGDLVVSFNLESENAQDGVLEIGGENINLPPDLKFYEASPAQLLLPNEKNR